MRKMADQQVVEMVISLITLKSKLDEANYTMEYDQYSAGLILRWWWILQFEVIFKVLSAWTIGQVYIVWKTLEIEDK